MGIAKKILAFTLAFVGFFILQLMAGLFLLPSVLRGGLFQDPTWPMSMLVLALTAVLPGLLLCYWLAKLRPFISYIVAGYLSTVLGFATSSKPQVPALITLAIYAALLVAGFSLALFSSKTLTSRSRRTASPPP